MTTLGLKNVNLLTKEQYDTIAEPANDELYAISGSGFGFPSSRYINLTLGASGTTYTAPANGWVIFGKAASGAGQYIQLASEYLVNQVVSNATGNILSIYIPVLKGKIFKTNYSVGGAINSFRFIYAEGEEE